MKIESVDTLIVGTGNGGLTAAIAANDLVSKNVLIIEKGEQIGGTSVVSGGGIWIPNSHYAKKAGAKDSTAEAKAYLRSTISSERVSDEMIDAFLETGPEMLEFLAKNTQVKYESLAMYPDYYTNNEGAREGHRSLEPTPFSRKKLGDLATVMGHSHPMMSVMGMFTLTQKEAHAAMTGEKKFTFIMIKQMLLYFLDIQRLLKKQRKGNRLSCGAAGVGRLLASVMDRNIPIWTNTALESLVTDDSGSVTGIIASRDGEKIQINVSKGVILTAGGFEKNQDLRDKYLPKPSNADWSAGNKHNTGDAILAGMNINAKTEHMDHAFWVTTYMVPGESTPRLSVVEKSLPGTVTVNAAGKRIANESQNYMAYQTEQFDRHTEAEPNSPCWMIFDRTFREDNIVGPLMTLKTRPDQALPKRYFKSGFLAIADTMEELAEKTGIHQDNLLKTITDFNGYAETGKDLEHGRGDSAYDRYYGKEDCKPNPCLAALAKPPFYAMRCEPGDFGTAGGFVINKHGQCVDADDKPIAGLYAAGNCTSAVLPTYPGPGSTLGPAMAFAYAAAKHIAQK
jgi:3-oxosteroid 1-dehydrogenase